MFILKNALAAFIALLISSSVHAQEWPTRPITLVVPFAAGGTTDLVARPIAQALTEKLGQPVVVENRAGAGGTLAAGLAAKAPPDGYTIFLATVAHTMAPGLYKSLPYDFEKDFDPVTLAAQVPNVLIVNPSVPAKTVGELIAYIKANPGKVNFGSAGPGSTEHMSGELFRAMLAVERDEAALVWRGMDERLPVEHRADCAPQAILQVRLVNAPRADLPGTTGGHAYDIVHNGRR